MTENKSKIITCQSQIPGLSYATDTDHPEYYMLKVPAQDDSRVLLSMPLQHFRVLMASYNNKIIANYRTCKNAKQGIYMNETINGLSYVVNTEQHNRILGHAETMDDIRVTDEDFKNRVIAPSSRTKGKIITNNHYVAAQVTPNYFPSLSLLNPVIGANVGTPIVYPPSHTSSEVSESH